MQAQRKQADPVVTAPIADAAPVERAAPVRLDTAHQVAGGDPQTSPAILLQEQLAARLAEAEASTVETQAVTDVPAVKWPMALRIATIVTLSLVLWGGIFLSAVALLT